MERGLERFVLALCVQGLLEHACLNKIEEKDGAVDDCSSAYVLRAKEALCNHRGANIGHDEKQQRVVKVRAE